MKGSSIVPEAVIKDIEGVNKYELRKIAEKFSVTAENIISNDIKSETKWINYVNQLLGE